MAKKLDIHRREYYLVSITACFYELFSSEYSDFFNGKKISEAAEVVRDGVYYWVAPSEELNEQAKAFVKMIKNREIDLIKLYKYYDSKVTAYEALITTKKKDFSLEMLEKFYDYYIKLFPIIVAAAYCVDFVSEIIPASRQKLVTRQLTKLRLRGERIHKDGEKVFVPKYMDWLAKKKLKGYVADDLLYVLYEEMLAYMQDGKKLPTPRELRARKKIFVLWCDSLGQKKALSGRAAEQFINENGLFNKEKPKATDELMGAPAFHGLVRGVARLIMSTQDMVKFKKGDIIVSPMTDPHYLPIMKKAAAFITDEGGLLCHAAIVARELKKPCIIGTKIATKILHDGDLLEVDANKGRVKIIR